MEEKLLSGKELDKALKEARKDPKFRSAVAEFIKLTTH